MKKPLERKNFPEILSPPPLTEKLDEPLGGPWYYEVPWWLNR